MNRICLTKGRVPFRFYIKRGMVLDDKEGFYQISRKFSNIRMTEWLL